MKNNEYTHISFTMDNLLLQSSSTSLQLQGVCQQPNSDDLINQMPDDVLVMVLSFLPIKDALITSILSKRWRFLWRYLMRLNFDGSNTFVNMAHTDIYEVFIPEQNKYINQVNNVIKSYNHPIVQDFRIHYHLNNHEKGVIDEWVRFALNKKVECLELNLTVNYLHVFYAGENYDFPTSLLNTTTVRGLLSLKQLILKKVNVSEAVLYEIIANAPHLETISIHSSEYLKHIRIGGRALNLKHFEITGCSSLKSIYLSDFDLVSFTYNGCQPIDLRLDHLPKLKEVDIGQGIARIYNKFFGQISSCASSLQALSLSIYWPMNSLRLDFVPKLPNVKKLKVTICGCEDSCLQDLYSIADACFNLEIFTIEVLSTPQINNRIKTKHVSYHPKKHLKLLKFVYYDHFTDFEHELAADIIHNAIALKKIVVDRRLVQPTKPGLDYRAFTNRLQSLTPRGVELVFIMEDQSGSVKSVEKEVMKLVEEQESCLKISTTKKEEQKEAVDESVCVNTHVVGQGYGRGDARVQQLQQRIAEGRGFGRAHAIMVRQLRDLQQQQQQESVVARQGPPPTNEKRVIGAPQQQQQQSVVTTRHEDLSTIEKPVLGGLAMYLDNAKIKPRRRRR